MRFIDRRAALTGLLGGVAASALPVRSVLAQTLEEAAPLGREWANMKWRRGIENQRMADLGDGTFLNPILSGDHPDPSISTVLTADTNLKTRAGFATSRDSHLHQFTHTILIEGLEWILDQNTFFDVAHKEAALGIITAIAKGHLGQVVGTEGEELGHFGHSPGPHTGPNDFEHTAELELDIDAMGQLDDFVDAFHVTLDTGQFLDSGNLGHHDFRVDLYPLLGALGSCFQNSLDLHRIDFRIGYP